jgi:hypothetical protein
LDRIKIMKTIVVDFDGVLHWYRKGWMDGSIYDKPTPGAQDAMEQLLEAGFNVVIFSTRALDRIVKGVKEEGQHKDMVVWLAKYNFPEGLQIWTEQGKPMGIAYIDDRAVRFNGIWRDALQEAMTLKPWNIV